MAPENQFLSFINFWCVCFAFEMGGTNRSLYSQVALSCFNIYDNAKIKKSI